ncbi:2'-5' RNA ligase family protein [Romboutsia lituseburensis]|uniref:2'-5' RNA ligase family protein n=1 Tax=Romboutsia lituseburensis TaxID=1537 RepID=UPI00215AD3D6|nr:2'-5' RNA ligase family protein [Romboutsia lituseburensis]MCR8744820.1 2'-5' RNA ligase family protein [Romboutsia lituseburensis]
MRYVIVSLVKGDAGEFNHNLRKDVFKKFKARSSKLPAHFTIKSPFESENIDELESALDEFSKAHTYENYHIKDYDHFDDRVIFMKVFMSPKGKDVHDALIDALSGINYINFEKSDGKDKIFHVTISSKKIQKIYSELWSYVNKFKCDFKCDFDNICIYKWIDNTWVLHKEYLLT